MSWLDSLDTDADTANREAALPPVGGGPKPGFLKNAIPELGKGLVAGGVESGAFLERTLGPQTKMDPLNRDRIETGIQKDLGQNLKLLQPEDTGLAGEILNGFGRMIPRAVVGSVFAGPAGAAAAVGFPEYDASVATSVADGIDPATAKDKGVLDATVAGVGALVPGSFTPNLFKDAALTISANVGLGMVQRGGTAELLEQNGYTLQAKQYKAMDGGSVAIDTIMSLGFMGAARFGARVKEGKDGVARIPPEALNSALVQNLANHENTSGPGAPVDAASLNIHRATLEETLQQLVRGDPVTIKTDIAKAGFIKPARGVRNNNPGNIEAGGDAWRGMNGSDGRFATFETPEAGIRALGKTLLTYQDKYKLDTVDGIINRWAPSVENDTTAYINSVAKDLGVAPGDKINLRDPQTLQKLTGAIIKHENGGNPYDEKTMAAGLGNALGSIPYAGAGDAVRKQLAARPDIPETVREGLAQKYEAHAANSDQYRSAIAGISQQIGTPHKPLIPDELKGADRAVDKVMADYGGDVSKIKDLTRSTIVVDNLDQAQHAIEATQEHFGDLIGLRNALLPDSQPVTLDGYRDIKTNVMINGEMAEVQINFPEMIAAKQRAHGMYEAQSAISRKAELENRELTADELRDYNDLRQGQRDIYDVAWSDVLTKTRNARSVTRDPLLTADEAGNLRDNGLSQASATPLRIDTGTPSTSRNSVSGGNEVGNGLGSNAMDGIIRFTSPEVDAARAAVELDPELKITLDDGQTMNAREAMQLMDEMVAQAETDSHAYNAAVTCLLHAA